MKNKDANDTYSYGLLYENTQGWSLWAKKGIEDAFGKHVKSVWYNENDKYLLFERSTNTNGGEYYSNCWSSNDLEYLTAQARRYGSYYDYVGNVSMDFSGNIKKLA